MSYKITMKDRMPKDRYPEMVPQGVGDHFAREFNLRQMSQYVATQQYVEPFEMCFNILIEDYNERHGAAGQAR